MIAINSKTTGIKAFAISEFSPQELKTLANLSLNS
jgi:hypothetical protein